MSFDVISKHTIPKAGAARARALVNTAIARSDLAKQLEITLDDVNDFFKMNHAYLPPGSDKTVNVPCILGYTGISQLTLFEAIKQKSLISSPKAALVHTIISKYLSSIAGGFVVLKFQKLFDPISRKYPTRTLIMNSDWITFVRKLSVPEGCVLYDEEQEEETFDDKEFINQVQEESIRKAFRNAGTRLAVDRQLFEASARYLVTHERKLITDILGDQSSEYFHMSKKQIANRKKMYDVYHKIQEDPKVILDDEEEYSLGTIALDTGSPPFYGYDLSGLMLHSQIERAKARVAEVRLKAQQNPRKVGSLADVGTFAERFKKSASIGPSQNVIPKGKPPQEEEEEEDNPTGKGPKGENKSKQPGLLPKGKPIGFITSEEVDKLFGQVHPDAVKAYGAEGIHIAWDDSINRRNFKECESIQEADRDKEFHALKCSCLPIHKNFSALTHDQVTILLVYRGAINEHGENIRMMTHDEASMFLFTAGEDDWKNPEERRARTKMDGDLYDYAPPQAAYSFLLKR